MIEEKLKTSLGVYHKLVSGVLLNGEISRLSAKNKAGGEIDNSVFNIALALFF